MARLEGNLWTTVQWMYGSGPVELHIPQSLRSFGIAFERDILVQSLHIWRVFFKSPKGGKSLNGRAPLIQLRTSIAMEWNFSMENVDVAHRLMMRATFPPFSGLSTQQELSKTFFTVLIVNAFRV